jgi:uncharacterized protein
MVRRSPVIHEACGGATDATVGRLIVFCRYPEPGSAKTRLIPALGPAGAAQLHRRMTERALDRARHLNRRYRIGITVCFTGGTVEQMRQWLGSDLDIAPQARGDLGERLVAAIDGAFRNAETVVVVGSDCPDLTTEILADAFDGLRTHDVVIGPAHDGGYYLIGLRVPRPELFRGIDWGGDQVFKQTMGAALALGLSVGPLPRLHDIDRPEDLRWAASVPQVAISEEPEISVIIPAVNEAEHIGGAICSAISGGAVEAIVVDGGSTDATVEIARSHGAHVLHSARGRGKQMNTGAAAARGKILLFLHADTRLPPGYESHVRRILSTPGIAAGAFALGIDSSNPVFHLYEAATNFRSRALQSPYGDQGLFLSRRVFESLGGFAPVELMEDLDLVRRLRRMGRIHLVNRRIRTSPRRWLRFGLLKTSLLNHVLMIAHALGVEPQQLQEWRESGRLWFPRRDRASSGTGFAGP